MITVLSTKKLTKKQKALFENCPLVVLDQNFIKTRKLSFQYNDLNEMTLFTSKNAVKSVLKNKDVISIQSKKCLCVGKKTKEYLEKKGFQVLAYKENAKALAHYIITHYPLNSFTFFSGSIRKDCLPKVLNENNIQWKEIMVYETILNPKKISITIDAILFFSPSGIESYLLKNKIENQMCFCIGKTTAKTLDNITKKVEIATQPSVENVIKSAINQLLNS